MEQQQFLRECARSYPEVMTALAYFRQLVQAKVDAVVQKRLKEFANVLGVRQEESRSLEYASPDRPNLTTPKEIDLGQQAKWSENLYLWFYLYWLSEPEEDLAPIGVEIALWIKDGSKREALAAKLDQHSETLPFKSDKPWNLGPDGQSYGFWMELTENDFPTFDERLDQLFGYTIGFLKSVKGIASYFEP